MIEADIFPCRYRLRLINSGALDAIHFSVDGHSLTVIEADGVLVEPYTVSSVFIAVAQRYSVILTSNQNPGAYWMRMRLDTTAHKSDNEFLEPTVLGVLRYGVALDVMPDQQLVDSDPGSGVADLREFDQNALVPSLAIDAPQRTRQALSLSLCI